MTFPARHAGASGQKHLSADSSETRLFRNESLAVVRGGRADAAEFSVSQALGVAAQVDDVVGLLETGPVRG